jgi:beta-galactosidase/beta-glucuronidase
MKNAVILKEGWSIRKIEPAERLDEKQIAEYSAGSSGELSAVMPAQVHEILLRYGKIEDPIVLGNTEKCLWVSESDWIYKCAFNTTKAGKRQYLDFKGLDTLADIYLNGRHIASHNDMYIPLRVDVTETLKDTNTLLVHFHSPQEYLRHHSCAAIDSGKVAKHKLLRKPVHDFIDFLGTKPYLTNIGIFGDVILETSEESELVYADI